MPIAHHMVLASGAVVAVSVAVATFIAIYESPELRQYADDVRRRIAMAFYSMGDGITPQPGSPASTGLKTPRVSSSLAAAKREELLYWNAVRLQQQERENQQRNSSDPPPRPAKLPRGSTFDDFLQPDTSAEHEGAYVFNSGADTRDFGGLRRRGEGARGFMSPAYSNPFADEHHIEADEIQDAHIARQLAPEQSEVMSDIYSATTRDDHEERQTATLEPVSPSPLIDVAPLPAPSQSSLPPTLERELAENEFMSAGQEDRHDVHASIQAWAQESSRELTPTDSISLVGSGEDIANDAHFSEHDSNGRYMDVMSESEGMATPASWSEVGSVISDNDGPMHA
ncbi:hypothetical protein TrVFT333_001435 [Trichoderma virens FT-333]|nr:hypothetical protein TrVFT333_001435 [Trichoderma virens FT-333]